MLSHNEPYDHPVADEQSQEVHLRGSAELPPIIPNEQDRPLVEPQGNSNWTECQGRTPTSVLTCLLKSHHPGLVEYRGKTVVATNMETLPSRFRFKPAREDESRENVGVCCSQLIGSIMYYARITTRMDHFHEVEKRKICDKIAGKFYLTQEEYIAQRPTWCKQACWDALATEWSSPEFKKRSVKNRTNHSSRKFKPHKGGSNSIATIRQKLSKKLGREVSDVEAWVHTHRGSNLEDITSLNSEEAIACLEKYKAKAFELNGPEFDWLHYPVDAKALYECSCGRPPGKWAIFNGIVKYREVIPELRRSHASAMAARHQRQEEEEHLRKEAHDSQLAKEYAQNMFEWGRMVHAHNVNIQKIMETVALHTGMPTTTVPSPLPPPPLPPAYTASPPPNPSPEYRPEPSVHLLEWKHQSKF